MKKLIGLIILGVVLVGCQTQEEFFKDNGLVDCEPVTEGSNLQRCMTVDNQQECLVYQSYYQFGLSCDW